MKIVIAHTGPISELIAASCVNHGIKRQSVKTDITWVVPKVNTYIFKYSKNVRKTFSPREFGEQKGEKYDLFITLWPDLIWADFDLDEFFGFGSNSSFDTFEGALLNTVPFLKASNLQLYFLLAGLTWKGEGYDIGYYPKTRTKKNRVGIDAANANLRNYVLDNLEIDDKKIWSIPHKQNIFRRMDEINRCKKVITDDLLTFHLSMAMKKYVYYLQTYPHTLRLETFGNGQIHSVPYSYLK